MQEEVLQSVSEMAQNTSYLSWDMVCVLGFFVLVCAYGFTLGKDHTIPLLVSVYIGAFLMFFVPFIDALENMIETRAEYASLIVFGAIVLIAFFILKTNGFFEPYIVPTGFELASFCIASAGLLLAVAATFLSPELTAQFSPLVRTVFIGDIAQTAWALVPIGLFVLIRGNT